ncbi:hypothetical protein OFP00_32195, partial [Escherichia coli]|nr:hypothetical protein [Escherichia coli]
VSTKEKTKSLLNQHKSGSAFLRVCASLYPISFFYTQNVLKVLYNNERKVHYMPATHPAPQNAGQYFELPGSGQGLSSQPEA